MSSSFYASKKYKEYTASKSYKSYTESPRLTMAIGTRISAGKQCGHKVWIPQLFVEAISHQLPITKVSGQADREDCVNDDDGTL